MKSTSEGGVGVSDLTPVPSLKREGCLLGGHAIIHLFDFQKRNRLMKPYPSALFLLLVSFALSACNLGAPAPQEGSDLATAAAQTVEAVLTSAASPTPHTTPTSQATPSAEKGCEQRASISAWMRNNVTYDKQEVDKRLAPGASFVMSWEIQNTGTCVWDDSHKMIFESGERITQGNTFPVMPFGYTVQPGETLTINITMTAPAAPGEYESTFSFVDADGEDVLTVGVLTNVGATSPAKLSAPGDLRYTYDCTSGVVRIALNWVDKADSENGYRIYRDGAKLSDLPAGSTTYEDIAPAPGSYQYTVAAFDASGESPAKVTAETTNCE